MLGWAQENGPWVMENGSDYFIPNPYSWNLKANVMYLESPAGVGYSYCDADLPGDCVFDDPTTADDNLIAVLEWFELFPEYKNHQLYLSGESYAGIYVPYLAKRIYDYNQENISNAGVFKPNLIGFAVGNGVTNWEYDCTPAFVTMGYWHALYSEELYNKMNAHNCDYGGVLLNNTSSICLTYYLQFEALVRDVDIYNIFGICWGTSLNPALEFTESDTREKIYTRADYTPWAFPNTAEAKKRLGVEEGDEADPSSLPPCTFGTPLIDYFNNATVRDQLHINQTLYNWTMCTSMINYTRGVNASQWIYEELYGKIRMMHYSGDIDGAVPTIGTQGWIDSTGWNIKQGGDWSVWKYGA